MRNLTAVGLFFLSASLLASCDYFGSPDESRVYLRVENASGTDFASVYVSFPGSRATFGALRSGETSEYRELQSIYPYGRIEVEADEEVHLALPIDFVGEEPLPDGRYTYSLDLDDGRVLHQVMRE